MMQYIKMKLLILKRRLESMKTNKDTLNNDETFSAKKI